jgi:hypothetical protein
MIKKIIKKLFNLMGYDITNLIYKRMEEERRKAAEEEKERQRAARVIYGCY